VSDVDPGDDPRVQAGIEHLQRAAREVIAASRALLDAAEELVEDPKAAGSVLDLLGEVAARGRSVVGRASGAGAAAAGFAGAPTADDDPDDGPAVQRIPVS
jgi:hypothetical protein